LDTEVKWIPALDIWAYFGVPPEGKSSPNRRYWNVFGIGAPSQMVNIVCEINPPVEGIDRRIVGGFAKGLSDEIAVIHRGRFNVHGGMTMQYFRHHYAKPYITVADGTTQAEVIVVGVIGASQFGNDLRRFVFEVNRIKSLARAK
jgi:hypothetical protein